MKTRKFHDKKMIICIVVMDGSGMARIIGNFFGKKYDKKCESDIFIKFVCAIMCTA